MNITFRKITVNDLEVFIKMRINQLREEGAKEDINLEAALKDYYLRHLSDGTFISWLALDNDRIIGTSGMSIVEKPPYFGCPSGKIGKAALFRLPKRENRIAVKYVYRSELSKKRYRKNIAFQGD